MPITSVSDAIIDSAQPYLLNRQNNSKYLKRYREQIKAPWKPEIIQLCY